ncbi:hypothetical protein [Runella limosa]|uniref:hypothetical protein n=1 Tax=Runella limosa TaxID=370978 RepID=UPI000490E2CF|nr:hypothetical protein [Runella limosa]
MAKKKEYKKWPLIIIILLLLIFFVYLLIWLFFRQSPDAVEVTTQVHEIETKPIAFLGSGGGGGGNSPIEPQMIEFDENEFNNEEFF